MIPSVAALIPLFSVPQSSLWDGSEPRPRGKVRDDKPLILWQMEARRPRRMDRFRVLINGVEVPSRYDTGQKAILAQVTEPLPLGVNKVHCEVWFDNDASADMRWEFTRVPAPPPPPAPDAQQLAAVAAVNQMRRAVLLPDLTPDPYLCYAALRHCKYLQRNKLGATHDQEPDKPEFYAETTEERVEKAGFYEDCYEDICEGFPTIKESIASLLHAPYHRASLIQPGSFVMGAAIAGTYVTVLCAQSNERDTIVYPSDGLFDVPCSWHDTEEPDPLRLYPGAERITGYPISFHYFGPTSEIVVQEAILTKPDGTPVDCYLNTPTTDTELDSGMALLIPKKPLEPETQYQVKFVVRGADSFSINRAWKFTTKAIPVVPPKPPKPQPKPAKKKP